MHLLSKLDPVEVIVTPLIRAEISATYYSPFLVVYHKGINTRKITIYVKEQKRKMKCLD